MTRKSVTRKMNQTPWLQRALRSKGKYFGRELISILLLPPEAVSGLRSLDSKRRYLSRQLGLREKASWAEIEKYLRKEIAKTWRQERILIGTTPSWDGLEETFVESNKLGLMNGKISAQDLIIVHLMGLSVLLAGVKGESR